jgi:hypothetical protein
MPTVICSLGRIGFVPRDVEDGALDSYEDGLGGVGS